MQSSLSEVTPAERVRQHLRVTIVSQAAFSKKHLACRELLSASQGASAIIFLDVDGVLHPMFSPYAEQLNDVCIQQLMRIVRSQADALNRPALALYKRKPST